ncbi:MAG: energy transducer TonB [Flavobacteriales bacterium]|nr:energy transducer TonB [Flavobacteriales bacterium]
MATGESEDEDARRYSVDEEYRSENKQENGVQLGGSFDQSGFAKEGLPKSTSEYDVGLGDDRPTSATPEQEMVILADESLEESELSKREIIEAEQTFKRSDKTRLNEPSGKKEAAAKAMTRDEETTTLKATDRVRSESSKNDYKGTKTKSKRQQAPSYASSSKKKRRTTSKGVSSSANMNEKDKKKEEPNDDSNTFGSTVVGNHIEADIESAVSDTVEAEITVTSPAVAQPTGTIGGLDTDEVAGEADQDPMFLGGEQNLKMYLQDNVVYPEAAENLGIQCKVNVTFTVNADSTISDANIVQPVGGGCDEEALRVVNNMPNWIPAQQKGKKVARKYNLEIDFESIKK